MAVVINRNTGKRIVQRHFFGTAQGCEDVDAAAFATETAQAAIAAVREAKRNRWSISAAEAHANAVRDVLTRVDSLDVDNLEFDFFDEDGNVCGLDDLETVNDKQ